MCVGRQSVHPHFDCGPKLPTHRALGWPLNQHRRQEAYAR